ncbi:MAG: HNH endonuclease signature motif containing protein [Solirubrobacteraceae bacterium]
MVYAATGSRRAHRVYWERENGEVPEGLDLDHLCKQTDCVNPEHLEPVTHQENMRRGCVTKLTLDEVREIKRLRGVVLQRDLASRFGLSLTHISRIQQGHAWGDVEP